MNPNAGMEQWVATAAANIKTGLGQALEENVDSVLDQMPGVGNATPAPLNIEAAAADSAASLSSPPVPIPAANVVPTAPAGSAREQMLANANRMEEGMSGRRRQQAVTDTYNVLLATNNSNRAAGRPVKTRQELLSEAQAMVNQQYPQGN
jgi:hypothetical protein